MIELKKLASEIAKREGKKSNARIGDIREILGILSDLVFESGFDNSIDEQLYVCGARRARRKHIVP